MNLRQLRFMGFIGLMAWIELQEKSLAEKFSKSNRSTRKLQKELLHFYGRREFDRLKDPGPFKLADEPCDQECIFCNPSIILEEI